MQRPSCHETQNIMLVAVLLATACFVAAPAGMMAAAQVTPAGTTYADKLLASWLTNDELAQWMDEFIGRCGSIAQKINIGSSVSGKALWVLEISDKPGQDEAEPNFKYIANMHGDETSGRMLLPKLAEWLCANNGKDDRATQIVRDMHIFLLPSMNPDGFQLSQRENAAGYDLNRNFPDQYIDKGLNLTLTKADTQPEVASVMKFLLSRTWLMGANFHEGSVVANYPWDGYTSGIEDAIGKVNACPDDATYKFLAKVYSYKHSFMYQSTEYSEGITNGAAWYPIYGGMQDWSYINAGSLHITFELSNQKYPAASQLSGLWDQNREALISLPLAAMGGIHGVVTSATTGLPVAATLYIKSSSGKPVPFRASASTGYYSRPLAPGKAFTLVVTASGYKPIVARVKTSRIAAGAIPLALTKNIQLKPVGA